MSPVVGDYLTNKLYQFGPLEIFNLLELAKKKPYDRLSDKSIKRLNSKGWEISKVKCSLPVNTPTHKAISKALRRRRWIPELLS